MIVRLFIIGFLFLFSTMHAQSDLKIGEWKSYLPLHTAKWVTQSPENAIYVTEHALVFINKNDLSDYSMDKVSGLSGSDIQMAKYDQAHRQLIVVYEDGNIDIIKEEEIENLPFLKFATQFNDKRINDIYIANAQFAYLSFSFGVIQLDLDKLEFRTTLFVPYVVNGVASNDEYIFMATEDGLYKIEQNSNSFNDFSKWQFLGDENGLTATYNAQDVAVYGDDVFVNIGGVLYAGDGEMFSLVLDQKDEGYKVEFLSAENMNLVIGLRNSQFNSKALKYDGITFNTFDTQCVNRILYGVEDSEGVLWYADEWRGFRSTTDGCTKLELNSPFDVRASHISTLGDKIIVTSGGVTDEFGYLESKAGFYILEDGIWTNVRGENYAPIQQNEFDNIQVTAPVPRQNKIALGSYYSGVMIYDFDNAESIIYNQYNSPIEGTIGDEQRARIPDLKYDRDGNLWMINTLTANPLKVLTKDGEWYEYRLLGASNMVTSLTIDDYDNKWISTLSSGVIVFNENSTFDDLSDDNMRLITQNNSELQSNTINDIEVDLDGEVWVGTAAGPVAFDCGSDPFNSSNCSGNRRKVLQDSIAAYLLETEDIRCIEFDGANRKWFGTRNGIFVQSPDGETQEYFYDINNSPLFNNKIKYLKFIGSSGEMFISSEGGLQVLKTNATTGIQVSDNEDIYAYPNPIRSDYSGEIAIKGFARDSDIKITDMSGKLVYNTTANGGQAIWNGQDYTGRKVAPGVYLVFAGSTQNFDEKLTAVTKIMIIK
ncbi:MAG TPA: hypothetical protein PK147_00910 [Saprospiraceae bacterium]|nr:T9SS type A sorting domain-containing protein [Saprospiraceae bacterium]MCB9327954.1 T9SS type A sorting domain-containing protein [Lewinellaceae bacterium]HPQ20375.1 hypothetical protein [Saprospiraceae bacterium]